LIGLPDKEVEEVEVTLSLHFYPKNIEALLLYNFA
jgi:hypothetical protein